jgi:hypothetical protein
MSSNGQVIVEDRFLGGKSSGAVVADDDDNLQDVTATYSNGRMNLSFRRMRNTQDAQDLAFTDNTDECLNLLIPIQGGTFTEGSPNQLGYHAQTPVVTNKVCIRACDDGSTGDANVAVASLTTLIASMLMVSMTT